MAFKRAPDARIWRDSQGYIQYSAEKGSHAELVANWLTSDVQGSGVSFIVLLDAVERRRSGRTERPYEASGNAWIVVITKDRVEIENKYTDHLKGTVPLESMLGVLRAYGDALGESALSAGKADFVTHEHRQPELPW